MEEPLPPPPPPPPKVEEFRKEKPKIETYPPDSPEELTKKVKKLAKLIKSSKHFVVHTGAGISTAAAIPDYRGEDGLMQRGIFRFRELDLNYINPTLAHMALVGLQDNGYLKCVITSNHDNLHRKSGIKKENIAELHGNNFCEYCLKCGKVYFRNRAVPSLGAHLTGRFCDDTKCNGQLKNNGIDFGQSLPEAELKLAHKHSNKSDVSLVLGSSLTVSPSCELPQKAKKMVIVNLQPTPKDKHAKLIIRAKIDQVMIELFKELKLQVPKYHIKEKFYIEPNGNDIRIFGDKYEPPNLFIEKIHLLSENGESEFSAPNDDGEFHFKETKPFTSVKLRITYNSWYEVPAVEICPSIGTKTAYFFEKDVDPFEPAKPPPLLQTSGTSDLLNAIKNFPGLLTSSVEAIGNTPLVELQRLIANSIDENGKQLQGRILAKMEYLNPGFSKKDRIARQIIEDAESEGLLQKGQTVVELTSGNTGTGLAIVCGVKGYKFVAVMSKGNSIERAKMMKALGAEVILVEQAPNGIPGQVSGEDLKLVEEETDKIVKERKAFRADQFANKGNFRAHYLHTSVEILEQSGGKIDAFVDFVGSGGTFSGCSRRFKEYSSDIKCFIVEPEGAGFPEIKKLKSNILKAILSGEGVTRPNHKIQGGGYSKDRSNLPLLIEPNDISGYIQVSDEEAMETARRLAREEGLFCGFSAGANVAAALKLLKTEMKGKTIVCVLCDSGLKYLSTDLWNGQ